MSNIALQLERQISGNIIQNEPVIFDTTTYSSGNINYNSSNGVITFLEEGRYVINWWAAIQSTQSTNGVVLALSSSQGDLIMGNSPNITSEVIGFGIIEVTTAPVTLRLLNVSTNTLFYSGVVPKKAFLTIIQDDITEIGPTGAIIPYSSGIPVTVTTIAGGLVGIPSFIGFGNSAPGLTVLGPTIDLTNAAGTLSNFAFSVPRDGIITSISGFFSSTIALTLLGTTTTLTLQLYGSPTPDNIFSPIPGASVDLVLTDSISIGDISSAITTGLNIPVTAEERLLLVVSATQSGLTLISTIVGYVSAGIEIA